jgi:hypothetical protein
VSTRSRDLAPGRPSRGPRRPFASALLAVLLVAALVAAAWLLRRDDAGAAARRAASCPSVAPGAVGPAASPSPGCG